MQLKKEIACPGSVGPTQLAQLFTNLGNPLPYDRLSAIMQQYDVSKKGGKLCKPLIWRFHIAPGTANLQGLLSHS